jgi:serine/threonine-protein kinase
MRNAEQAESERERQLDAIIGEYYCSVEKGEPPDQGQFIAQFPNFQQELSEFFADLAIFRHSGCSDSDNPGLELTIIDTTSQWQNPADGAVVHNFGAYEILDRLGCGGMGVVYKAHQLSPDRIVALKMLRVGRYATDIDVQRFVAEVDAIAKLEHPNIVSIYESGSHHGEHFYTMQLVQGSRFDEYLASEQCDRSDALEIFSQVCDAVAHCHDHGIIHRDLKPSNILLDEKRTAKLTDFGLAKHLEKESDLTRTGDCMGTPGFMAPEQADGSTPTAIDRRADVYSLGAILYKILTGHSPIDVAEVNLAGAIQRIRSNEIIAPRSIDRWIPRDLETICMKCLDVCPTKRYQNARELAEELRRYADREPIAARPISCARRLLRWSRQQPGLAVTWLSVTVFYLYHLTLLYLTDDVNLPKVREEWFNKVATVVALVWVMGAYGFQKLLFSTRGARWPLFGWATMEVALLTYLLSTGWAGKSPLVVMYPVLVAVSVLRFQPVLVSYRTFLCVVAYSFQVWRAVVDDLPGGAIDVGKTCVPLGLSILCVGLIQYFALRRTRTAMELALDRRT